MTTDVVARLESVATRLEAYAARLGVKSGGEEKVQPAGIKSDEEKVHPVGIKSGGDQAKAHPALGDYDEWVKTYVIAAEKAVAFKIPHAKFLQDAAAAVRHIIDASCFCKKPSDTKYLEDINRMLTATAKANEGNSWNDQDFKFLAGFEVALNAICWVSPNAVVNPEAPPSKDIKTHTNRIVTEKNTNAEEKAQNRAFANSLLVMLEKLEDFRTAYFKMGLTWNAKGGDIASYKSEGSSSSLSSSGGPPPAPELPPSAPDLPPAPTLPSDSKTTSSSSGGGGMAAVFSQINSGAESSSATQAFGLKHVSKEMKSKNITAPVLAPKEKKDKEIKAAKALLATESTKKGPVIELKNGNWYVNNFDNKMDIVVSDVQMKQAVYISNCNNCYVYVSQKCKQITMDLCTKTTVRFKSVVSTFEVINSTGCHVQIDEMCPVVSIDKTHGFSVTLKAESYKNPPDIVTSNVSELNLVHPSATENADPIEIPLPEQYITKIDNKGKSAKLKTEPVSHGG